MCYRATLSNDPCLVLTAIFLSGTRFEEAVEGRGTVHVLLVVFRSSYSVNELDYFTSPRCSDIDSTGCPALYLFSTYLFIWEFNFKFVNLFKFEFISWLIEDVFRNFHCAHYNVAFDWQLQFWAVDIMNFMIWTTSTKLSGKSSPWPSFEVILVSSQPHIPSSRTIPALEQCYVTI